MVIPGAAKARRDCIRFNCAAPANGKSYAIYDATISINFEHDPLGVNRSQAFEVREQSLPAHIDLGVHGKCKFLT